MKKIFSILSLAVLVLCAASCSKSRAEQMALAENVVITCNPEVLQLVGGKIPAEITVTYPEGYFHPEALLVVTPVLVYDGGSQTGTAVTYQGEKVKNNYKVVSSDGGTVKMNVIFDYAEGVENSTLELRSAAFYRSKRIEIPNIKVADGCVTTSNLVDLSGVYSYAEDGYQEVLHKSYEGQILYDVNSAEVKGSQLRSQSIKELQEVLKQIGENERTSVTGTQIVAYASPEGGKDYNAKLSDKRAGTAEKAWSKISKDGAKADDVQVQSIGQDWDGFQEAVSNSDIQDKELILRVLSMYSDPAVRESEIRNMSQIYTEISDKVFPELRRARFIANYDFKNFSDEELEELSNKAINVLDEPALLKVAANTEDSQRKSVLYNVAVQKYDSQKAIQNLASMSLDKGEPVTAEYYIQKLSDQNSPVALNAKGVAEMLRGNYVEAVDNFKKSGSTESLCNLGALKIAQGDYQGAVADLKDDVTTNKALANILAGNLDDASKALTGTDGLTDYLKAIVAARQGKVEEAKAAVKSAVEKDASLAERAAKDIEFAKCR